MALTLICPDKDPRPWIQALSALDPTLEIRVWPDDHPKEEVEMALTWAHPSGCLLDYPGLQLICSMGAGVDHLFSDPDLPCDVPLVRLVDRALVRDMTEYLSLCTLFYFRQFDRYQESQAGHRWEPLAPMEKRDFPVGIMGMGELGKAAAMALKDLGFPVSGWKRGPGTLAGVEIFWGERGLWTFLSGVRLLICLLPLTAQTRQILDISLFSSLLPAAVLVNAARGGHLKEGDLLKALDQGMLSGACLDVAGKEPLDPSHPFWSHPKIRITPHVASQTDPFSVAPQILANLARAREGQELVNRVWPQQGY